MTRARFSLSDLVGARAREFRTSARGSSAPADAFVTEVSDAFRQELARIPALSSGAALVRAFDASSGDVRPGRAFSLPTASRIAMPCPRGRATRLYDAGFYVFFDDVSDFVEPVRIMCRDLERALHLAEHTVYARAFATTASNAAEPHFDPVTTFHVQLEGEKTWWLAPNPAMRFPLDVVTLGTPAKRRTARLADRALPSRMPDDARRIDTRPGSLVYVPPAYLHATETKGASLGLVFTASGRSVADEIAEDALHRLSAHAALRAPELFRATASREGAVATAIAELRRMADELDTRGHAHEGGTR